MTVRIHFFGYEPDQKLLPLAAALGVGKGERLEGADSRRYERLESEAPQRWAIAATAEEADVLVCPRHFTDDGATRSGAELARSLGKPCLFFHVGDSIAPCRPFYGVVYRESAVASQMTPAERILPGFADDLLRETGGMQVRVRRPKPMVGFCGYVGSPMYRLAFRLQGRGQKVLGLARRSRAMRRLENDYDVATTFIRRKQFWGGAIGRVKGHDWDAKRRVRDEYLRNIIDTDYTLCVRGAGNFSYRLYETLSLGRIPLFINTDCRLPFDDEIDWRRHCVWVEESELDSIGQIVREFHDSLSDTQFETLQHDNRRLWEQYLRPTECYQRILERELATASH